MKFNIKQEKGVSMLALVITVLILIILTNVLIYNAQDSIHIKVLTDLYNDIDLLRNKVSVYYNEYGKIPAEIKYTNIDGLSSVIGSNDKQDEFYIIDLEAMQGITLNYGKDYEKVKNDKENANTYTDIYIINQNSHNIFYVQGIKVRQGDTTETHYTDYTEAEDTTIDLRYIDGILIPEGYYYIGKTVDESIVISNVQEEAIDATKTNQYTWTRQTTKIEEIPSGITLAINQEEYQFIKSVNTKKGYFKNTEGKVQFIVVNEEEWSEAYTKEIDYEDINGDTVTIPQGFRVSMSPTMNVVENGFVVKDSNDNEWVWVVVPESVFATAVNNADYDKIEADLIKYAEDYRNGSATQNRYWTDEWYAMDGDTLITASTEGLTSDQKQLRNGCGLTFYEYEESYQKMLSSIYTNKGFWVSRYEIGDSTATKNNETRTSSSGIKDSTQALREPVSKPNQIPYNYVTCTQAQTLANEMSLDSSKTSSLLFGIQWDLVCKFLEENSSLTKANINSNSTSWGNYSTAKLTLNRGKYNVNPSSLTSEWTPYTTDTTDYVIDKQKINGKNSLLTTGASEQTRVLNIYDFAGNEIECTLEYATSRTNNPCACRGGYFNYSGSGHPASYSNYNTTSSSSSSRGFRSTLY